MDTNFQRNFTPETGNRERALSPSSIRQQELQQQSEALAKAFRELMESKASAIRAIRSAGAKAPLAAKLADELIAEVERGVPSLLRLAARDGGFDVRNERDIAEFRDALEKMRTVLADLKERFDEKLEPIARAVTEHNQRQAEQRQAAQDAAHSSLARGMSDLEALRWVEETEHCHLRVENGKLEIAPSHRAHDRRIVAMLRLHPGVREIVEERQTFAPLDLG